ncbi:MAG TPA: MgtC/SapB family protein [Blastocatellia bacterium]|jgi:uncharacterized membrane protein (DUF4010 family)|nr:MgtC/SapB family protein [Blastocatellia bacterium]
MEMGSVFQQLGIALGLGLLVGLQREHSAAKVAGVRTFPLITILGAVSALLAQQFGGWIIATGLLSLTAVIVIGNLAALKEEPTDPGVTTEVAMLLMFGVGAYLVVGRPEVAIATGAGVAVLLQFKGQLHGIANKLGDNDLTAIMQFALVSLVILPVLPNRTYGPYDVLNPYQVWLMVVLIVGISLGGYVVYKFFGQQSGMLLGGILGGVISSTATTVSYSRRTSKEQAISGLAGIVIMIASAVVFARVLLEIFLVTPSFFFVACGPILILFGVAGLLSTWLWFRARNEMIEMSPPENPTELKSAIFFGLLYALVLFAVAAAKDRFGDRGLYVVAGLSGLTDVDAITLSTSQLVNSGRLDGSDGWRLIVVALTSNMIFKAATVAVLGHRVLLRKIAPLYGAALLVAGLLLIVWR